MLLNDDLCAAWFKAKIPVMVKMLRVILSSPLFWALLALLIAVALKLWLAAGRWIPFNADEASMISHPPLSGCCMLTTWRLSWLKR